MGGSLRDTNLVQSVTNLNFSAGELEFKKSFQVVTPDAQPDEIIIVLAAAQLNDVFIPTDMKKSTGAQTLTLSSMAGKPPYIVNVIKKQSDFMTTAPGADRMSASLLPFTASAKQRMLPLVNDPTITTTNGYTIRLPASPTTKGIYPLAITTMLSDLIEVPDGSSTVTIASPRWEVVGLGWGSQIQLPKWPLNNPASKMRVGINFLGSNKNVNPILDDSLIEASTYVTHASTDF